ncbi:MAG: hypothetical protein EOO04_32020 [Chitinophagaceae bacterium]|nr:MAG: hypothetical protein EOO04_32020 [Chitinophagaceae bacterium]
MESNEITDKEESRKCPMSKIDNTSKTILTYIRKRLKQKYGEDRPLRAVHAKSIGLVNAFIDVEKLSPELSIGLFRTPGRYDAFIRFTNGSPRIGADNKRSTKGMAIRIFPTGNRKLSDDEPAIAHQDIVLLTSQGFYPESYDLQLSGIITAIGKKVQSIANAFILSVISPFKAFRFFIGLLKTPNVLEETFYSCTPYKYGNKSIIKWAARPLKPVISIMPGKPGDNYLREKLIEDLSLDSRDEVAFELLVQFQESKTKEPIENTAVIWKTPFHRVAKITIPPQYIDTIERGQLDLNTYFCPGNAIKEHAPLGSVNMIRSQVYSALGKERIDFGTKKKNPVENTISMDQ